MGIPDTIDNIVAFIHNSGEKAKFTKYLNDFVNSGEHEKVMAKTPGLTADEALVARAYTCETEFYKKINNGGMVHSPAVASLLKSAINKFPATTKTAYRAIPELSLDKIKGLDDDGESLELVTTVTSTTSDMDIAIKKAGPNGTVMIFEDVKAHDLSSISANAWEAEQVINETEVFVVDLYVDAETMKGIVDVGDPLYDKNLLVVSKKKLKEEVDKKMEKASQDIGRKTAQAEAAVWSQMKQVEKASSERCSLDSKPSLEELKAEKGLNEMMRDLTLRHQMASTCALYNATYRTTGSSSSWNTSNSRHSPGNPRPDQTANEFKRDNAAMITEYQRANGIENWNTAFSILWKGLQ